MKRCVQTCRREAVVVALAVLVGGQAFAQQPRGTGVAQHEGPVGKRRAVIVGISRYSHLAPENQLRYASADAELFYHWLVSKAGGATPAENIRKLVNDSARGYQIREALNWLTAESKEGDEAIIYFAGHGDVDTVTVDSVGYLLAADALPWDYESGGGIEVEHLGGRARTIAAKKASVVVITDACRSGTLVNEAVSEVGAHFTTFALMREWKNVYKLVSSSAEQSSYEDVSWGGGHGVFTYFLVKGLEGMADMDGDGKVSLDELAFWVGQRVDSATKHRQTPQSRLGAGWAITAVDSATLKAARASMGAGPRELLAARAVADTQRLDPVVKRLVAAFQAALNAGDLSEPPGDNAWEVYQRLRQLPAAAALVPNLARSLAGAFEERGHKLTLDYQLAVNSPPPSAARLRGAAQDLDRAVELLGQGDELVPAMRAEKLFLEGYALVREEAYVRAVPVLKEAIRASPRAAYSYNALGLAYLGQGLVDSATHAFNNAHARAPRWPNPLYNLGLVSARQHAFVEAERQLTAAIMADTSYVAARVELASLYAPQRRSADAERMLVEAVAHDSTNGKVAAELGALYLDGARYSEAVRTLRRAIWLDPTVADVYVRLALALYHLEQMPDAMRAVGQAIARDSTNTWAFRVLGFLNQHLERFPQAEAAYRKAVALDPRSAVVAEELGAMYLHFDRLDGAAAELARAVRLDSSLASTYDQLARLALKRGQASDAERQFRRAALVDSSNPDRLAALGSFYEDASRYAEAEEAYRRAIRLDTLNADSYDAIGAFYYRLKRYREAAVAQRRAGTLAPRSARIAGNLGLDYVKMDSLAAAEREFRRAVALDSLNFARVNQLGWFYMDAERYAEAEPAFRRARQLAPRAADSADVSDNLGLVYQRLDRVAEAEREFRRAITLDSLTYWPHVHLGRIFRARNAQADAEREFRRAVLLDSTNYAWPNELGWLFYNAGRYPEALAAFGEAQRLAPTAADSADIEDNLGLVLLGENHQADAEETFRRAIVMDRLVAWPHVHLADRLAERNEAEAAEGEYRRAIELDSLNSARYTSLGNFYYRVGRDTEAVAAHERAVALAPQSALAAGNLAMDYQKVNRLADAEREYRRAIALDSLNVVRVTRLAWFYYNHERYQDATNAFRRALRVAPGAADSADIMDDFGLVDEKLNHAADAERSYRLAIRLDSLSSWAHVHLLELLAAQSRYAAAAVELKRTARFSWPSAGSAVPSNHLRDVGRRFYDAGRLPEAEASWREALRLDSTNSRVMNSLAWFLYGRGALADAATYSDRSLEDETIDRPTRGEYVDTRANIWLDAGDPRRALVLFDQAAGLNGAAAEQLGRAMCLLELRQEREAVAAFREAVQADSTIADPARARAVSHYSAKAVARIERLRAATGHPRD